MKTDDREEARKEARKLVEGLVAEGKIRKPYAREMKKLETHLIPESKYAKGISSRNKDDGFVVPGDSSKLAIHMLELMTWEVNDDADVPHLIERFKQYVEYCVKNDIKMGNEMCYMAMGIGRDQMELWLSGNYGTREHYLMAKKIKQFLSSNRESQMLEGKLNPIVGIWWQKNYDGLRDQQEVVISSRDPLENIIDVSEIEQKYLESVGIVENPAAPPEKKVD